MKRMFKLSAVVTAMALVAACGGDGPVGTSGDPLTEAEVQEIAFQVFAELGEALGGGFSAKRQANLPAGLSLSGAAVPFSHTFDVSAECGGGGSVSVEGDISGDIDQETYEGELEIDITESITNCVVEGENITATLNGEPNIRLQGTFEFGENGESFSAEATYTGGFSFVTDDGREGTCGIDFTSTITYSSQGQGSINYTASGTVCGVDVDEEFIYGA